MNTDWQWVQLGEISEVISKGTTPTTHGVAFLDSGIPFLRAEDVVGGAVDVTSVKYYVSDKTHDTLLARSKLQPGDFLITIAGSLGRVGYVPLNAPPLNCNQAVAFVRLKPNAIDLDFLLYVFQYEGITKSLLDIQKVGTIGNLNLEQIRDFKIPLPPLTEQKRIASLLARADRLRQLRRTAHDLGDALLQSVFLKMFGDPQFNDKKWDKVEIAEVTESLDSRRIPVEASIRQTKKGQYPYYGASGIIDYVDEYLFDEETLLIGEDGANLISRSSPIAFIVNGKYWVNNHAHVLKMKNMNIQFLCYLINVTDLEPYVTGSAQPKLNASNMEKIRVINPLLSLQEEFAGVVAQVESLRGRMGESTRQVEGLFESLLSEIFEL